ncbi:MAG: 2Fe-2S iron-sulfur cluster-binding protein [Burkholderiales bacterium]|jgi:2Fe-2S ferredoxin|nr:2Fe-2S iron-sulfur cluster-binding protein [Burkholderiales bacterium]
MIQLIFIYPDGQEQEAYAQNGQTLLSAAQEAGVAGFVAECGGNCTCATCHCYIQAEHAQELFEPSEDEQAMLGFTAEPREQHSRLACQILVEYFMDGMRVYMPERQI